MKLFAKAIYHYCLLIIISAGSFDSCVAQSLPRKAQLGIRMETLNDSLATTHHIKSKHGVWLHQVFPETTIANMGLEQGAVITEINNTAIHHINDVLNITSSMYAGDPVSLRYEWKGKIKKAKGKAVGRPTEVYENAAITYGDVSYNGNQLRSILYTPKGQHNAPVIFYLQGYTCESIDWSYFPEIPMRKMIHQWVDAGFAVYRVEKPGVGDSKSDTPCLELGFEEELEAFRQAYQKLQKNDQINPDQVFLFGHSVGGIIAPILASEFQPRGVITYGTVVKSWFEYMIDMSREQAVMNHLPYAEIELDTRRWIPFWYDMLEAQKSGTELANNPAFKKYLQEEGTYNSIQNGYFIGRSIRYWQEINQQQLTNVWEQVDSDVLALYGSLDIQALSAEHIHTISQIVNSKHPGKATAIVIPNSDHAFAYFDTMEDNIQSHQSGQYWSHIQSHYNTQTALTTIQWINQLLNQQHE